MPSRGRPRPSGCSWRGASGWIITGDGVIVCKDGFRAGFMRPEDFQALWERLGLVPEIQEVDGSAVFCEHVVA